MHDKIPIAEIMAEDVVTAPVGASATDAVSLMRDENVSSVVIVDDGSPVGILTEGDFVNYVCEHEVVQGIAVRDVMSAPLTTITPDKSIYEAVDLLRSTDVEHLPVVGHGAASSIESGANATVGEATTGADSDGGATMPEGLVGIVTTTELSHFVPQLVHPAVRQRSYPPKRQVRTDTEYIRDDWNFEYRGEDPSTVSVGDVARFSKRITVEDVEAFAEVSGDTSRVHLDPEYADETRFQNRIVHGILSNGLISAALARFPGLSIYLSQTSSFLAPVDIGDTVTAHCEVRKDLGGSKYQISTIVLDGGGETVLEGEAVILIDEPPSEEDIEG